MAPLALAYIHLIEGSTASSRTVEGRPCDWMQRKAAYRSTFYGAAARGHINHPALQADDPDLEVNV